MTFGIVSNRRETKRSLEDYLNINKKLDLNNMVNRRRMITRIEFADSVKSKEVYNG